MSAALNAAVRNKQVLLMGSELGGMVSKAPKISNYLGLAEISGKDLVEKMKDQVASYDNITWLEDTAQTIYPMGDQIGILRSNNDLVMAYAVVVATGVNFGKTLPGEDQFMGKGVGTCATCDAALYKGKKVVVVAYTDYAAEEANFIAELAGTTIFINMTGHDLDLSDQVEEMKVKPKAFEGEDQADRLLIEGGSIEADGFFVIRDAADPKDLLPGIELDGSHIKVDQTMATNLAGIFAAGDLVGKPYQVSTSAGRGQVAGLEAAKYASEARKKAEAD